ncbi:MAG: hypothetical protein IJ875_01475, partial [Solobacterium sp.]|nr:hypothetical protein [Solobacterium sp.]
MKILITPLIIHAGSDAAFHITRNLATLFHQEGHSVAISAPKENTFSHAQFYPTNKIKPPFLQKRIEEKYYEDFLYNRGAIDDQYLKDDLAHLKEVIEQFQPDVIVTLDRIASILIAKEKDIPSIGIVNQDMYKSTSIPSTILRGVNEILKDNHFDQILNLSSLYDLCDKRILFGPLEIQPILANQDIHRIGISSILQSSLEDRKDIFIYLNDIHLSKWRIKRILDQSFKDAPFSLNAYIKHNKAEQRVGSIRYMAEPNLNLLKYTKIAIHDGNDYLFNLCMALGIPQLIITDHSYLRNRNGLASQRYRFGLCLYEEEVNV